MYSNGVREKVRKLIAEAGAAGISAKDIAAKLRIPNANAVYCHIHRLRENKVNITFEDSLYRMNGKTASAPSTTVISGVRPGTKQHDIVQMLRAAGDEGVHKNVLAKKLGIQENNVACHMHDLRSKGIKIDCPDKAGRYILRSKMPGTGNHLNPTSTPVKAFEKSNSAVSLDLDPKLVEKLKILSASDREDFLDMLKKQRFYGMCAEALINASQLTINLRKEISDEI